MEDLWAAMTLDLISVLEKLKKKPGNLGAVVWHLPKDTPLWMWDQNWTHRNGKRLGAPTEDLGRN